MIASLHEPGRWERFLDVEFFLTDALQDFARKADSFKKAEMRQAAHDCIRYLASLICFYGSCLTPRRTEVDWTHMDRRLPAMNSMPEARQIAAKHTAICVAQTAMERFVPTIPAADILARNAAWLRWKDSIDDQVCDVLQRWGYIN